eukprot:TRINITY_DN629_c3_g1_i1.p1 TRINITY_DN629_c3_g1~~TRINITY_DN629_c3_g1_i1.p1  ORF type:complete len:249 (+),score=51.44 TRINITY_DN629_c3_g1_i1:30-749(+)
MLTTSAARPAKIGVASGLASQRRMRGSTVALHNKKLNNSLKWSYAFLGGPAMAQRKKMGHMSYCRRNRTEHMVGVPFLFDVYTQRMRPEKDLPFGNKFFSRLSADPDQYFPQVENPYEDGRSFRISTDAKLSDLSPYLLHEVDDRISEAEIRHDVAVVAQNCPTVQAFLELSQTWGWLERMEALSSRLVVHHLRLLTTVISSQYQYTELRRRFTTEQGILRTASGDRFYALPGSKQTYL